MDDAIADYIAYWGQRNLTRWPEAVVARTALPAASKAFLVRAGLPVAKIADYIPAGVDWDLSLSLYKASLAQRLQAIFDPAQAECGLRLLGARQDIYVLVDEHHGGRVFRESFTVHWRSEAVPESPYNSSIEQYAWSLTEYDKMLRGVEPYIDTMLGTEDLTEQQRKEDRNLRVLEPRLTAIDPEAMAAEHGIWPHKLVCIRAYHLDPDEEDDNP